MGFIGFASGGRHDFMIVQFESFRQQQPVARIGSDAALYSFQL